PPARPLRRGPSVAAPPALPLRRCPSGAARHLPMNGEESLLYERGGPAFADGGPDRVGPDGVLRVARMQLIGADPALRPDSRRACGPDVDPREIPRFGFFSC